MVLRCTSFVLSSVRVASFLLSSFLVYLEDGHFGIDSCFFLGGKGGCLRSQEPRLLFLSFFSLSRRDFLFCFFLCARSGLVEIIGRKVSLVHGASSLGAYSWSSLVSLP